jgi:hypothetical protein
MKPTFKERKLGYNLNIHDQYILKAKNCIWYEIAAFQFIRLICMQRTFIILTWLGKCGGDVEDCLIAHLSGATAAVRI